jgi:GrpB-like predicted nucleotidyltransferase (UPF0157 family)
LLQHDQNWRLAFRRERHVLANIFADNLVLLEHIGSTAIREVAARPIIDVLAVVKDLDRVDLSGAAIAASGYHAMGENGISDRRVFFKNNPEGERQIEIFVHAFGSAHIPSYIAFREYLNATPPCARRYAAHKLALLAAGDAIDAYTAGKAIFIEAHEAEALAWFAKQR